VNTRIIAVANIKGGATKTTSVVNLAAGLGLIGRRVLVVDADAQANATFAILGTEPPPLTLYNVLIARTASLTEAITPTRMPGVDLIPSHINLSEADLALAAVPGRERLLARRLREIGGYDYILIDTPPALSLMSVNSLTSAREVFVPVSIGVFALLGIPLLESAIAQIHENLDQDTPVITGAIISLYDRTRVADDTERAVRAHFGDLAFNSIIPKYKDVQEAQGRSQSIFQYAPASPAAIAYHSLVQEVIDGESQAES
jgi:chromosome partitioning protein